MTVRRGEKNTVKKNNSISSVPFTGFQDWILRRRDKSREINDDHVITKSKGIDFEIIQKSLEILSALYIKLNIQYYYRELPSKFDTFSNWDEKSQKLATEEIVKKAEIYKKKRQKNLILLGVFFSRGIYWLVFTKDKKIPGTAFFEIMEKFQYLYNCCLISGKNECSEPSERMTYVPANSYPHHYECFYSSVLEKLRWESGKMIAPCLLPAADLFSLPSYAVFSEGRRRQCHYAGQQIGYDPLKILDIRYKRKIFKTEKAAADYLFKKTKPRELLLLSGNLYFLPYGGFYKKQNLQFDDAVFSLSNISLFFRIPGRKIAVHSPNLKYFGTIPMNNFLNYWGNYQKIMPFNSISQRKKMPEYPFQVLEISALPEKMDLLGMLYRVLSVNVREFYQNRVMGEKDIASGKKTYFGQQVIKIFSKEIWDNLKKNKKAISDITILEMLKRMKEPYLFLMEILTEICVFNESFKKEAEKLGKIIHFWENIYSRLMKEAERSKIDYRFVHVSFPDQRLRYRNFLTNKSKEKTLATIGKISDLQDELFRSLRNKLGKIKIKSIPIIRKKNGSSGKLYL